MPNARFKLHIINPSHGDDVVSGAPVNADGDFDHLGNGVHNALAFFEDVNGERITNPKVAVTVTQGLGSTAGTWTVAVPAPSAEYIGAWTMFVIEFLIPSAGGQPNPYRRHAIRLRPVAGHPAGVRA